MKKVGIIIATVLVLAGLIGGAAHASQGSLPGDTLYNVKLATEGLIMGLPADGAARAERGLAIADRRIEEIVAIAEEARSEYLDLAVDKYDYALGMALTRIEEAANEGLPTTGDIAVLVAEATYIHWEVLTDLYGSLPEDDPARQGLAIAIDVSVTGHERAVQVLDELGIEIQMPEIPPLPVPA